MVLCRNSGNLARAYKSYFTYYQLILRWNLNFLHIINNLVSLLVFLLLQSSGVKISQVTYRNIQGTSGTVEAVTFYCSPSTPCTGIRLQDIKLTYLNKATTSSCKNIGGTSTGLLMPDSCIQIIDLYIIKGIMYLCRT